MNFIVCCNCGDTPRFSEEAYKILFPKKPTPNIYHNNKDIEGVMQQMTDHSPAWLYLRDLLESDKKYSYYMNVDKNGNINKLYNLITGRKAV